MKTLMKWCIMTILCMAMHSATAQQTFLNACESVEPTTHSMYNVYVAWSKDVTGKNKLQVCNSTVVHGTVRWVFPTTIFLEESHTSVPVSADMFTFLVDLDQNGFKETYFPGEEVTMQYANDDNDGIVGNGNVLNFSTMLIDLPVQTVDVMPFGALVSPLTQVALFLL